MAAEGEWVGVFCVEDLLPPPHDLPALVFSFLVENAGQEVARRVLEESTAKMPGRYG